MIITENGVLTEDKKIGNKLQALRLKADAVNRTIENLLNKKIRIDLEIKKQKNVLQNLKKQSSLELKTSLKLESFVPLTLEETEQLKDSIDPFLYEQAKLLDQELDRCTENLQVISDLEAIGALNQ